MHHPYEHVQNNLVILMIQQSPRAVSKRRTFFDIFHRDATVFPETQPFRDIIPHINHLAATLTTGITEGGTWTDNCGVTTKDITPLSLDNETKKRQYKCEPVLWSANTTKSNRRRQSVPPKSYQRRTSIADPFSATKTMSVYRSLIPTMGWVIYCFCR
jgi:hypothetical protein